MSDDHIVSGPVDPVDLAAAIVRRPGMYLGAPVTFDKAAAYVAAIEIVLFAAGKDSALTDEHRRLLRPSTGDRSGQQEREDIQRLEPVLVQLLAAAQDDQN